MAGVAALGVVAYFAKQATDRAKAKSENALQMALVTDSVEL